MKLLIISISLLYIQVSSASCNSSFDEAYLQFEKAEDAMTKGVAEMVYAKKESSFSEWSFQKVCGSFWEGYKELKNSKEYFLKSLIHYRDAHLECNKKSAEIAKELFHQRQREIKQVEAEIKVMCTRLKNFKCDYNCESLEIENLER